MIPPIVIRADASAAIGSGHVMRCLALAQAWRSAGGTAVFIQAETTPGLDQRLRDEEMEVVTFSAPRGSTADVVQTINFARTRHASWIVADGYCFDSTWQKHIREAGLKLLVIDDYGQTSRYHANLILNQNLSADASLYAQRDADTRLMLGPRFSLLRQEFLQDPRASRNVPEVAKKVLVTLGGSDPDNVTAKVMAALQEISDIEAIVVVGGSNPHFAALEAAVDHGPASIRIVVNATNMPELMAWADVAITAGGSTSWELACLGLPAVQMVLAENQAPIAASLDRAGATVNLGDHRVVDVAVIAARVRELLGDAVRRRAMSKCSRQLVDGHGATRVAAALGTPLQLTLLSDPDSWINNFLPALKTELEARGHAVRWIHDPALLATGDIAFFLSLSRIVPSSARRGHAHNLVVHESALPHGRGWSPLTWQVLEGKDAIPVTLLEAVDEVDAGDIYAQESIRLRGDELVSELRAVQATATSRLCVDFVANYPFALAGARAQTGSATHYPRRRPADSRLDLDKTLREQFNLLRVCDPDRYPAFFELGGRRYAVRLAALTSSS